MSAMRERVIAECCGVSWAEGTNPPPFCPNCGRPWGGHPPIVHRENGGTTHRLGYIAWCSCGVGSPPKESITEARSSLAAHIADPDAVRFPQ